MSTLKGFLERVAREFGDSKVRNLQEYMMGGLRPRQRANIERRMIEDEEFFQELLAAEEALIEDYVQGRLPSSLSARVAALGQTEPEWERKIQFTRATYTLVQRQSPKRRSGVEASLFESLYGELKAIASSNLALASDLTMEPADLVNEAYLRMSAAQTPTAVNRVAFLSVAAAAMRRVLVDLARKQRAEKHDLQVSMARPLVAAEEDRVVEIDLALDALAKVDARLSRVVELRIFGGLNDEEIANVLEVSSRTVKRDWALARAWLHSRLSGPQTTS